MLGKRYLKEGVVPTTNEISVLCYSGEGNDEKERCERHPDGHFIHYLPASLLKQMSLVDTPGANVILQRQQRLTEEFLPRADLVLFIISADRPLTESEVNFLRYIRQWGKKIIFILNKSDIFKDIKEIEAAKKRAEKNIDSILRVSNVEVAAEYILRGDRSKSMPAINNFEFEVIGSAVLDIQKLLGEYWTWLISNNAQHEGWFKGLFEDRWPSLASADEFNRGKEKSMEEQMLAKSTLVLEEFNVKAAAVLFEQEIREVVIETFGGLGVAGLSASVLTSVLPTTLEDLIALTLCSAGGLYGVWKLPQRRIEVKGKVQRIADSFATKLETAMQEDLEKAMRDAQSRVDFITKPYHDAAQAKANRLDDFLMEIKDLENKMQILQFKVQNLGAS